MRWFIFALIFVSMVGAVSAAAPVLEAIPSPQNLTEGIPYTYIVNASDPEGGILVFTDDTNNFEITALNSTHALISFVPTNALIGNFTAVIIVRDAEFLIDAQAVIYDINGIPVLSDLDDKNVTVGDEFIYDIDASDPEDGINIKFSDNSTLFDINVTSGVVNFTPSWAELGEFVINITVNDTRDANNSGRFSLAVNDYPNMTTFPESNATEDIGFQINISDYVNNSIGTLTYSDNTSYFDIDVSSGVINFTPNGSLNGSYSYNITVDESYGLVNSQIWYLNVTPVNDAPLFDNVSNQTMNVGQIFALEINATDEEGDEIYYFDNSTLFDINISTGLINFTINSSINGTHAINLSVNDSNGAMYHSSFYLTLTVNDAPAFPANQTIPLNVSVDTYVDSQFSTANYLGGEYLQLSNTTDSVKYGYLNFTFDPIPNVAAITSAILNLTINTALAAADIAFYEVNETWAYGNITFDEQPLINLTSKYNVSSNTSENVDSFDITDLVGKWFNGTNSNYGASIRLNNDSDNSGTIKYYSEDSSNSTKWPYLYVYFNSVFADQTLGAGSSLNSIYDLDDYFFDSEGDILVYNVTQDSNVNISIDSNNTVSINATAGYSGAVSIMFTASDGINVTDSNTFTVTVTSTTAVTPTSTSSSSSSGGSSSRTASLNIILDAERNTITDGEVMHVPVLLQNNGEVNIRNIDLSVESDKDGLALSLTAYSISSLSVDDEESLTLTIEAIDPLPGSYVISLNAQTSSPDLDEAAIFILDVASNEEELMQEVKSAQDFFRNNPECLELQEMIDKAEDYLKLGNYDEARNNLDLAIDACKNIIRSPHLRASPGFPSLGKVLIFLTLVTIVSILLYTIFTRMKLRWR